MLIGHKYEGRIRLSDTIRRIDIKNERGMREELNY